MISLYGHKLLSITSTLKVLEDIATPITGGPQLCEVGRASGASPGIWKKKRYGVPKDPLDEVR